MDAFYCHDNVRDSKEQQWISTRCEYEIRAEVECPLSRAELLMWRQQHLLFFPFFPIFFFRSFLLFSFSNPFVFFSCFSSVSKFNGGTNFLYPSLDPCQTSFVFSLVSITPRLLFTSSYEEAELDKCFRCKYEDVFNRSKINVSSRFTEFKEKNKIRIGKRCIDSFLTD